MPTYFVSIASGTTTSSQFALARTDRALAVFCNSAASSIVRLEWAPQSGGTFQPYYQPGGSGVLFAVMSGANGGVCVVDRVPSAYGRVALAAATTSPRSFSLVERG